MTAAVAGSGGTASVIGPRQLLRLRTRLEQQQAFRLEQVRRIEQGALTDSGSPIHREIAESLLAGARSALRQVREALAEIDAGSYGLCHDCRAPLQPAMLETVPQMTRCPDCLRSRQEA